MTFGKTSTADEVLAGIDLSGKTAIVTGASGGLGEETARALAARGAKVTILARSQEKLDAAAVRIKAATGRDIETGTLELHRPDTVRAFAESWLAKHDTLDILVNNAGIMMTPYTLTDEGWELQFATCHLGHFLLGNLMMPAMKNAGSARLVSVASAGHAVASVDLDDINYVNREYDAIDAYGQAKTANVWFANEIDRRFKDNGIRAFSLHPGGIQTDLGRHLTPDVMEKLMAIVRAGGGGNGESKTIPQGAATSCFAAVSPELDGKGGLYLVDCAVAEAGEDLFANPAKWAFDSEAAAKLWDISNKMLGTDF